MEDMELDGTPVRQPEDIFKGDSAVTAEQSVKTGQAVQEQPVSAEAQPQPQSQPAAEAVAEEKPKWVKIVELISIVCIAAAGILAALFMCLMNLSVAGSNVMLNDVASNLKANAKIVAESEGNFEGLGSYVSAMFYDLNLLFGMLTGIVAGLICGIILIVKIIKKFALKQPTALEKTAITSCLFFFAVSVMVLSLANAYLKSPFLSLSTQYGGATLAGLILCGILFAAYFICKIVANYKSYLSDRTKLINGCMNFIWAVVAVIVFSVLSCVPVMITAHESGVTVSLGTNFNKIFSGAVGDMVNFGTDAEIPDDVALSLATQFGWGALGMLIQIWFVFQTGKSLHGAMRGTIAADKTVKLGSQIWRTAFAVVELIICIVLAKDLINNGYEEFRMSLAAPIVILVFSIIGLVIAIVNKILVKEQSEKREI